jgi:hypothetical protein
MLFFLNKTKKIHIDLLGNKKRLIDKYKFLNFGINRNQERPRLLNCLFYKIKIKLKIFKLNLKKVITLYSEHCWNEKYVISRSICYK